MKREKTTATLLIAIFIVSMLAVGVQAMHFRGMNGGSLSVISLDLSALTPEEAFNAEPETLMLDDMAFDAQSDTVTITGTLSELGLGAGWPVSWPNTAYVEIGVRPSATKNLKNSGVYMILFASGHNYDVHLQDYTGHGNSLSFYAGPDLAPFTYKITLNPNTVTGIGGTADLVLYDKYDVEVGTNIDVEYGCSSTWEENVAGPLEEDFSEAYLFYSIIADRRGVAGEIYSATVGDITTNILLPHPEVWVDDDYYDGSYNDGHVWGIDAFATIQEGVDVVDEGGTVYVAAGIYQLVKYGEIKITDKSLTLLGAQANIPIVEGEREGEESIIRGEVDFRDRPRVWCLIRITHSDVVVNGFTIEKGKRGIAIQDPCEDILISYNYIVNNGIYSYEAGIFRDDEAVDVTIDHNYIAFNPTGIATRGGGTAITDNTFYSNGKGIDFKHGDPDSGYPDYEEPNYPTTISGNTFTNDKTSIKLSLRGHQPITITGNDITESRTVAIETSGWYEGDFVNPAIHYNNIWDNEFGINNQVSEIYLDAILNWWGHASGPSGEGGRKDSEGAIIGKGDAISLNVDWDPRLPQPVGHTKHYPVPKGKK